MAAVKTVTVKVTPRTLALVHKISARTGEKQYRVFERAVERIKFAVDGKAGKRK